MAKNKIINVNIIIDTTRLMRDFKSPSKDQNNPTGIGHNYQYMVVSEGTNINGQGTGDLSFTAVQGDVVRFYAVSEYNNYDNPVILYNLFKFGGVDVFNNPNFELQQFSNVSTVAPKTFNPLTLQSGVTQNFWFAQNTVNQKGTENYGLRFALYNYDDSNNLILYGYFAWDPTIIAK
ncbi:inclusion body family protein [Arcicella aquatica]|uniref:Inclusion body family protein n=1 Tax=Arcicella aquatica TaxID=217141 RepID=A0ABU5QNS8_9BACT|nr:inclusion body family protein [Arcicella aquatica]MEA5258731.1 inclusion body family protein [Arcicella aquatica]